MTNEQRRRARVTEVLQRDELAGSTHAPSAGWDPGISEIRALIDGGEEPARIFSAIVDCAANTEGITAAGIFLPNERNGNQQELIAHFGEVNFPERRLPGSEVPSDETSADIVCLGAPIGSLVVRSTETVSKETMERLRTLAHYCGVVFERQRLSLTLQHFIDRLEVLNELNQLIATNVGLQRVVKSVARESAFRFAADVALAFLIDEDRQVLEVKGGYGCAAQGIPPSLPLQAGVLGNVLRSGGHLSVPQLANYPEHGVDFLLAVGVVSADICCLEVRGEPLGVLLIGYRRTTTMNQKDLARFDEFAQGAAVAIANARAQERLTAYTERLEELVASRTADLERESARAEEANQAKSRFLANMSHELRTPLTAIVGYSSVLVDGIFGPLNEKQKDALTAVTRSSDHLKNLIDDVLNIARIESGKEEAEPERVLVKDLLTQTTKLILQTAVGKGVTMTPLKIPDEVMGSYLFVDGKHVHQIIINLLSNSVKYTPKGGRVWVEAEIISDKVKILVHDTGVGIPPDKQAKLFERFERGEDAYSKRQEGTGIGLHLTKQLVELNGGRIGVTSEVGKGSTFWIMLPMAAGEHRATAIPEHEVVGQGPIRLDGLSTLVVDDSEDTCAVLSHILAAAGANVTIAHSVKEGLEAVKSTPPDIVLTDLAMPGDNGLVLIQSLRTSSPTATLPILVLSACAFDTDRETALKQGANAFLAKPFRPSEVVGKVRDLTLASAINSGSGGVGGA